MVNCHKPDAKDKARANDICTKWSPCDFSAKAYLQLAKITNRHKFYRRLHAFLDKGIKCDLRGTIMQAEYTPKLATMLDTWAEVG